MNPGTGGTGVMNVFVAKMNGLRKYKNKDK